MMTDDSAAMREALEAMCRQFAYRGETFLGLGMHTGGLSALEMAFEALGWPDPIATPEDECEWPGCHKYAGCGMPWKDDRCPKGYIRTCGQHFSFSDEPAEMAAKWDAAVVEERER